MREERTVSVGGLTAVVTSDETYFVVYNDTSDPVGTLMRPTRHSDDDWTVASLDGVRRARTWVGPRAALARFARWLKAENEMASAFEERHNGV